MVMLFVAVGVYLVSENTLQQYRPSSQVNEG